MITASLMFTIIAALIIVNVVMWLLEIIIAIAKVITGCIISRPCSFKDSYRDIRIIFTLLIQKVMFAQVSPRNMKRDLLEMHASRKQGLRKEILEVIKDYHNDEQKKAHQK